MKTHKADEARQRQQSDDTRETLRSTLLGKWAELEERLQKEIKELNTRVQVYCAN